MGRGTYPIREGGGEGGVERGKGNPTLFDFHDVVKLSRIAVTKIRQSHNPRSGILVSFPKEFLWNPGEFFQGNVVLVKIPKVYKNFPGSL